MPMKCKKQEASLVQFLQRLVERLITALERVMPFDPTLSPLGSIVRSSSMTTNVPFAKMFIASVDRSQIRKKLHVQEQDKVKELVGSCTLI